MNKPKRTQKKHLSCTTRMSLFGPMGDSLGRMSTTHSDSGGGNRSERGTSIGESCVELHIN